MKERKIIALLIIVILILICTIYNLINKVNANSQKQIIKEMTEIEYEDNITSLNTSHEEYANYIVENKKKIASAITEKGIETSEEDSYDVIVNNIKDIESKKEMEFILSAISYSDRGDGRIKILNNGYKKLTIKNIKKETKNFTITSGTISYNFKDENDQSIKNENITNEISIDIPEGTATIHVGANVSGNATSSGGYGVRYCTVILD